MVELDKVIAGLEFCGDANKSVDACLAMCPYYGERDGDKVCMDFLMEDALNVIGLLREENARLERKLKYARAERDAEIAKEVVWLEKVHPDWYSRLEGLDYNYDPIKDGTPWYRAEDVWACKGSKR